MREKGGGFGGADSRGGERFISIVGVVDVLLMYENS